MAQQSGIKSSGIGYGTFAPDLQSEQLRLQRQQQLIDALRKDSVTPIEQQTVTGAGPAQVVPVSKWQGLAKLGQAYFANNMQDSADQKQLALSKLLSERMGQQFDKMAGGGSGSQQPNYAADPNGTGGALPGQVGSGMADTGDMPQDLPLPSMPSQSPMDTDAPQYNGSALASALKKEAPQQPAQNLGGIASFLRGESTSPLLQGAPLLPQSGAVPMQQPTAFEMQKTRLLGQAKAAYLMGNQELANKLIENASMLTEEQRNMAAKGINPLDMGAAELNAKKAAGLVSVTPDNSLFNVATNKTVYVAPNFKIGTAGGVDSTGEPFIKEIKGSENISKMAGDIKRAESMGAAGSETIVVDTPNGKVLKTKEQAAKEAAQNGVSGLDLSQLKPEEIAELAKKDPQAFAAGVANFQRTNNKQSGIPLKSDEAKEFGSAIAKGASDDLLKGRDTAKAAENSLYTINESRKAIAGGAFLGSGADAKTDVAKAAKSLLNIDIDSTKLSNSEYLRTTLGQGLLDNAKKLGVNPTDADARRIDAIVGTISKDPTALSKALDFQEEMAIRAINKHNSNVSDAESRGLTTPYNLTIQLPKFDNVTAANPVAATVAPTPAQVNQVQPVSNGWNIKRLP